MQHCEPETPPAGGVPYALGTLSAEGGVPFPALIKGDLFVDLRAEAPDVLDILAGWTAMSPRLRAIAETLPQGGARHEGLRVHAPLVPRQIFQAGMNYRTHVIDLAVAHLDPGDTRSPEQVRAETEARLDQQASTGRPYMFLGLPSAVAGPYDDLVLPSYSDEHDWELELGVVIGREAFRVSAADALSHVAGYVVTNDVTTRDLVFPSAGQRGNPDFFSSKNAPGFLPLGPWLVPAEFVADPMDLRIELSLNGRVMQDESTKDMIFDVAAQIAAVSRITPLRPGDLVLTGSPAGNGKHWGRMLRPGDVMAGAITGLGRQVVRCVAGQA